MQPIQPIIDDKGVARFQENAIVRFMLDWAATRGLSMNDIAIMEFSDEDRQQFAQLIGYDLCGFGELSYVTDEAYAAAEGVAPIALDTLTLDGVREIVQALNDAQALLHDAWRGTTDPDLGDAARNDLVVRMRALLGMGFGNPDGKHTARSAAPPGQS